MYLYYYIYEQEIFFRMWLNLDWIGFDWDETISFPHPCCLQNSHFGAELSHYEEKMTAYPHQTRDM